MTNHPVRTRGRTVWLIAAFAIGLVLLRFIVAADFLASAVRYASAQPPASRGSGVSSQAPAAGGNGASSAQISAVATSLSTGVVDINTVHGDQNEAAAGTGIVVSADGLVLTNNHVVAGATSISVTDVGNGQTYPASVVGYDRSQDVAVVQLSGASGLTVAPLGDSSTLSKGDSVVAIGNAGGAGGTPSAVGGTVTALDQSITAQDQSTGTSGQLTGLIEAGQASTIIHIGATAFLGIQTGAQTGTNQASGGIPVLGVLSGSPAQTAGLTNGDVIQSVNGQDVDSPTTLTGLLDQHHPGDRLTIGWADGTGQTHTANVTATIGPVG